ncbi:MAG: hypothetical protein V4722_16555 [Bacteroidota bacterium]
MKKAFSISTQQNLSGNNIHSQQKFPGHFSQRENRDKTEKLLSGKNQYAYLNQQEDEDEIQSRYFMNWSFM